MHLNVNAFVHAAGKKEKVAGRIAKRMLTSTSIDDDHKSVCDFLKPTLTTTGEERPFINEAYANSFNLVDKLTKTSQASAFYPGLPTKASVCSLG